ncbi:MAG: pyridinium-3,5-bisthiocarboxylic acid mononucleotide nickel chelatase [Thermodesulfobacteriota bacterium]|nr:pyridinium-3,5-bisthiocarboxylic acid mononucleotide nickel chelatase [Thermodesulfobacteriota bacterium]
MISRVGHKDLCMRIAYFDCFSGAGGDMILGSLLDAGLPLNVLCSELDKLGLDHYQIEPKQVLKRGLRATQAVVAFESHHDRPHQRHLSDIKQIIHESGLASSIKEQSIAVFTRLAQAEARVHQVSVEEVHFHEVGAMDAIIDVVGSVVGLASLKIERVLCSPLHLGSGTIECAHGILPVPSPATAELVRGKPVYATEVKGELLTPTGAAILTTLASDFGPMPAFRVSAIGYGAGTSDFQIPNLLRVMIGDKEECALGHEIDRVAIIETNIDDMNPQIYEYVMDHLFRLGALDAFLIPVHMKKNRPGTLVTVICPPESVTRLSDFLIRETTTIGLRWRIDNRIKASRALETVNTKYGEIRVKVIRLGEQVLKVSPEYDDCRCISQDKSIPLRDVMDEALRVGSTRFGV